MILAVFAMGGATAAVIGLTWRLVKIAKRDGMASILTAHAGETLLHACLLFTWMLFVTNGLSALLYSSSHATMAGFGALFGGIFAMCLSKAMHNPVIGKGKIHHG